MPRSFHMPSLDRVAVGLSGLCLLHCVATVVLLSVLSAAGTFLTNPAIHEVGLFGAIVLAAVALGQGYVAHGAPRPTLVGIAGLSMMALGLVVPHGWAEVAATVCGVSLIAAAHLMNARIKAQVPAQ